MATVNIRLRISSVSPKEGTVYFQIIHRGAIRKITSRHRIFVNEWRAGSIMVPRKGGRVEKVENIRRQVDADRQRLCSIIRNFDSRPGEYSADDIVNEYRRYMRDCTLFAYMNLRISRLREHGRKGTAEHYATALRSFSAFRGGDDVMIDSIDRDMIESYEAWMKTRGLKPNTVSFYLRTLRCVYRRAVSELSVEDRNPFRCVFTGREQTMKRALPAETLKKMRKLKLPAGTPLAYARDMFLLSFYLRGMSFIDMAYLRTEDLTGRYLNYRRKKTDQLIRIKWLPEMQRIVNRYLKPPEPYLLPIFSHPGEDSTVDYHRIAAGINRSLKKIGVMLGVEIPLTMYVARHSWASVARQKGVSLSLISEGMGHTSEATTRIYLSTLDTTLIDHANSLVIKSI